MIILLFSLSSLTLSRSFFFIYDFLASSFDSFLSLPEKQQKLTDKLSKANRFFSFLLLVRTSQPFIYFSTLVVCQEKRGIGGKKFGYQHFLIVIDVVVVEGLVAVVIVVVFVVAFVTFVAVGVAAVVFVVVVVIVVVIVVVVVVVIDVVVVIVLAVVIVVSC